MIQTPKAPKNHSSDLIYAGIGAALWVIGAIVLAVATSIAGGHPAGLGAVLSWPLTALTLSLENGGLRDPWTWVGAKHVAHPALFWGALQVTTVLCLLALVPAYNMFRGGIPLPFASPIKRSSTWATRWELRRLIVSRAQPRRIMLGYSQGALIATQAGASLLIFGPTQSGKSSALAVPAILEHDGPVLAISVKRDLVDITAGWRQRLGQIHVFDPTEVTGIPGTTWSPLDGCEFFEHAIKVADWMTQGMDKRKGGETDWQHWRQAANRLLSAAFYAAACLGEPMGAVRTWIDDGTGATLEKALRRVPNADPRAWQMYMSIKERPERERQTCYSTTQGMLQVFIEEKVTRATETCEFRAHDFLLAPNDTLYLVAPIQDQNRLTPLFTGLVMTVINEAAQIAQASRTGHLPKGLLCVLDELANTAPIEELPQYLSTGFSQWIQIIAIVQDKSQLINRYGQQGADTVCNNSRARIFLPGIADPTTLDYLSKLVGAAEEKSYSYSAKGDPSYSFRDRELLPSHVARQIREGTGLLVYHTLSPALVKLRSWYLDPELTRRGTMDFIPGANYVGGGTGRSLSEFEKLMITAHGTVKRLMNRN